MLASDLYAVSRTTSLQVNDVKCIHHLKFGSSWLMRPALHVAKVVHMQHHLQQLLAWKHRGCSKARKIINTLQHPIKSFASSSISKRQVFFGTWCGCVESWSKWQYPATCVPAPRLHEQLETLVDASKRLSASQLTIFGGNSSDSYPFWLDIFCIFSNLRLHFYHPCRLPIKASKII